MNNQKFWEYLIQITIVIFGVFLGMLLNDWNTDRKAEDQQKVILTQILNELAEHESKLDIIIPYHKTITQVVDSILKSSDENQLMQPFLTRGAWSQIPKWKGIQIFPMHNSAYESAKISNVLPNIDNELLKDISSYYESIALYNGYSDHITRGVFNTNSNTKLVDALLLVVLIRGDLLGYESEIKKTSNDLQLKIKDYL